jgi:hypothetical protein
MSTVPGLTARLSAVLGRDVAGYETLGDVLVELLELLEHLQHERQGP